MSSTYGAITVQKMKQTEPIPITESEERFRTLISQSADAIQLLDHDGKIIYSSDSVKRVLGYTPEEIKQHDPTSYIHPADLAGFARRVTKVLSKPGRQMTAEYRVKHKNGSWVWIETTLVNHLDDPLIQAAVGNFRNITKCKAAEAALKESEERLQFMVNALPQKVFTADKDGTPTYYSTQWHDFLGLTTEQILEQGWINFVHPDDRESNASNWQKAAANAEPFITEHRFRDHTGTYVWHLTRAVPMKDKKGRITMWIGSSTDIEDLKHAQLRQRRLEQLTSLLSKQKEHLLALNRAKDEFISVASHQLRTPATGVKQYLGMIQDGYAGDDMAKIKQMLKVAYDSNERQLKIIDDLLKVANVDAGRLVVKRESCDLSALVRDVLHEMQSTFARRNQPITIKKPKAAVEAFVDTRLIRMVLENILDNASKYSGEGKPIIVTITQDDTCTDITIRDHGVGISQADKRRLFKKFSRIDNALSVIVGGNGLGLYWAKKVIDLHKGDIEVESVVGKGTAFTIKLPIPR